MTHPNITDPARLNSATKYPSIRTHHALGERGALLEEPTRFTGQVIATEKVDGAGGRIVLLPGGDYAIGSREDLLHARGDRIINPTLGIVEALLPLAERLAELRTVHSGATTYFLEVYGDRIGKAANQYQSGGGVGHRLFDVAHTPDEILGLDPAAISTWRENGGQNWADEDILQDLAAHHAIPLTPRLATLAAQDLPESIEDMHTWLARTLPATLVALDDGARGGPEGIVLRDSTRSVISKARFQNYRRTLELRAAEAAAAAKR
ncbi:RNA ligase family protein [Streptacidiphilus sp. EB103A]|uniref:RNA ligase family protein n=1 Tax=Streptacidiphilus sp. EB103A TaxID=3156275 RepID=UPI00351108AE